MRKTVLTLSLVAAMLPAHAGMVTGAQEITQLMNNAELIVSNATQAQQLAVALRNMAAAPQMQWGNAQRDLQQLVQLVSAGQAISYAMQNADQQFRQRYPGYSGNVNYGEEARMLSRSSLDGFSAALQAAGLQHQQFANEHMAIQQIRSMSAGSPGATQLMQAGIMIADMQVDQMQKMRVLQMRQNDAMNTYYAGQVQRQERLDKVATDHFKEHTPTNNHWSYTGVKRPR